MDDKQSEFKYINGYNNGFLLSRFEPELFKKLTVGKNQENPYIKGLVDGGVTGQRELFKENLGKSQKMTQQVKPR